MSASIERYTRGQLTRRELLFSLSAMAMGPRLVSGQTPVKARSYLPVPVTTLNHMTFSAADVPTTAAWYIKVFGMQVQYYQNNPGSAVILKAGKGPDYIALSRGSRDSRGTVGGLPHFCWGMKNYNVDRVMRAMYEMATTQTPDMPVASQVNAHLREEWMPEFNFKGPDGHTLQFQDERSCGGGEYLGNYCHPPGYGAAIQRPGDPPPIATSTINHVMMFVPDLKRSLAFYQKLTDMRIQTYQELEGGPRTPGYEGGPIAILRVGTGPQHLALTQGPRETWSHVHMGLGVEGFDADQLLKRLTEHGVTARIRLREGVTKELLLEAPDGVELQLTDVSYCGGGGVLGNVCDPRQRPFPGSV